MPLQHHSNHNNIHKHYVITERYPSSGMSCVSIEQNSHLIRCSVEHRLDAIKVLVAVVAVAVVIVVTCLLRLQPPQQPLRWMMMMIPPLPSPTHQPRPDPK